MKQTKLFLLMAAMLLGTLSTSAYDFMVDGIAYNKLSNNTDVSVSYLSVRWETQTPSDPYGDFEYIYYYNEKIKYSGYIEIPSVVNYGSVTYNVTSIAQHAFQNCSNLTSITIPESVTSIGNYAFKECSRLASITLSENLTSIGYYAFENCSTITSVNIPESVTTINNNAFSGCSNLTSITCHAATPPTIASYTFYNVSKSIPVYVPAESVNAYKAANHWSAFTNIQPIPTNDIASGTCGDNLTWKLTEDGELVVEGTGAMYDFSYGNDPWHEYHDIIKNVVLLEGVTSIGDYAFRNCSSLTTITIPYSVTSIRYGAFLDCSSLTAITIPEGVKFIGGSAFFDCSSLTAITLPEGVTSIRYGAFLGCSSLTTITIPNSVTSIGDHAFQSCSSLTSITIPESVTSIGQSTFYNCSSLTSITIPASVTSIGNYAFCNCSSLTSITIPENVTYIGGDAFDGTPWYNSLPDGVVYVNNVLYKYKGTMPENTSIEVREGTVSISRFAFQHCSSLTSITIPASVTSIGYEAFYDCSSLTAITSHAVTPPTIGDSDTFRNVRKSIPVYVPAESVNAYKAAAYWSAFTNIQPIEEPIPTVTITIGQYGSGTYCSEYALDFSEVEGLKAYAATGYDSGTGILTLTRVMTAKAGEGLFIKGEPGEYTVPTLESTSFNTLNMLVGVLENTTVNSTSNGFVNYKYTKKNDAAEPMFYPYADGSNISAGKAYLQIPLLWLPTTGQKSIRFRFDDGETTDIEDEEQFTIDNSQLTIIYDLYGRKVDNPVKGSIYIVGGKKIVY